MKNTLTIAFALFYSIFFLIGCSNDDTSIEPDNRNVELEKLLFSKYNLSKIDNSNIDFTQINFTNNDYEMDNAEVYQLNSSNEQIAILPNSTNSNKFTILRGNIFDKEANNLRELVVTFKLDNEKNGTVDFVNIENGNQFTSIFEKGVPVDNSIKYTESSNTAARGLCQREGNEGFKECFKRESDEFQDDFVSTVAYITNPQIALLIAALCSC